eukprot:6208884-Pleurochrysis_carterae.AAC.4
MGRAAAPRHQPISMAGRQLQTQEVNSKRNQRSLKSSFQRAAWRYTANVFSAVQRARRPGASKPALSRLERRRTLDNTCCSWRNNRDIEGHILSSEWATTVNDFVKQTRATSYPSATINRFKNASNGGGHL